MSILDFLSDGNLVLCGSKENAYKLKSCKPQTGRILNDVSLDSEVRGMSTLKLGRRAVVAISYR